MIAYNYSNATPDNLWARLHNCAERGIHVYDETKREFIYTSYKHLHEQALIAAAHLAKCGIGHGTKVLLSAKTTPHFPPTWLALVALGAIPVPLPPRDAMLGKYSYSERLTGILPHYSHFLGDADDFDAISEIAHSKLKRINIDNICFDSTEEVHPITPSIPKKNEVAFIQYTSGSTNKPKGIMVTYGNLYTNVHSIWERLEVAPETDAFASWLPMYHDMGLIGQFLSCLTTQTSLILVSPRQFTRRPIHFLESIQKFSANYCTMPNFALEWILKKVEHRKPDGLDLSSLKWLGIGAEPISHDTLNSFSGTMGIYGLRKDILSPCYGLAEATLAVSITAAKDPHNAIKIDEKSVVNCGAIVSDMLVKVEHPDSNGIGTIKVSGPSVVSNALIGNEVKSLLDNDGYYNTKDIGLIVDNDIYVLGRADEMFVVNGENIFPYDLEAVVRQMNASSRKRAACFSSDNEKSKNELVMLIELNSNERGKEEILHKDIKNSIAMRTGHLLDKIVFVPPKSIPVTPSGKIQRTKAKSLYQSGYYSTPVEQGQAS